MADPVKVELQHSEIISAPDSDLFVIDKLREAGIPAKGDLLFTGTRSGKLVKKVNFAMDTIEYTWQP